MMNTISLFSVVAPANVINEHITPNTGFEIRFYVLLLLYHNLSFYSSPRLH